MHHLEEPDELYQEVVVAEVIVHEGYGRSMDNDIMLLKLETPLTFTDGVVPVCLPDQGEPVTPGLKCYTTGWGALSRK